MNKAELVAAVAAKTGDTKKAAEASVDAFVAAIKESLKKGEKVQLVGFGSFEVVYEYIQQLRNNLNKENKQNKQKKKDIIYRLAVSRRIKTFRAIY